MRCPCGADFNGEPADVNRAYRQHSCAWHPAERSPMGWPEVVGLAVISLLVAFVCSHGFGTFR